jgi:hypothetical protein
MYVTPKLERFGTLRELTLIGLSTACDGISILGTGGGILCSPTGGERS